MGSPTRILSSQFVGQSHQLAVLPDETVAFFAFGTNGCEDIKERAHPMAR